MKSVKPGRGPSGLGALSGIFAALFGVFWIVLTISIGAWFMAPFGVIFVIIAIVNVIYNYKNATGEERYSVFDIVDSDEERDPFDRKYGKKKDEFIVSGAYAQKSDSDKYDYCPYCGKKLESDFEFCPYCGRKI